MSDDGRWVWISSRVNPPSTMTVWDEGNPEIGRILGPNGNIIRIVRAKPERQVGFRKDRDDESG